MRNISYIKRQFLQPSSLTIYTVIEVMSKIYIPIRPSRSTSEVEELDDAEEE